MYTIILYNSEGSLYVRLVDTDVFTTITDVAEKLAFYQRVLPFEWVVCSYDVHPAVALEATDTFMAQHQLTSMNCGVV